MKATVQTGRRLIVATLLAVVIGVAVVLVVIGSAVRSLAADRVADVLASAVPHEALAACRAGAPRDVARDIALAFYDAAGTPLDAGAPLDRELVARAAPPRRAAGTFDARAGVSRGVIRLDGAGRCAYAQAQWRYAGAARAPFLAWVIGATTLVALAIALIVSWLVARPLLARLSALRRAAVEVGGAAFRPAPPWPDEAGEIAAALAGAHDRIVDDARRLADRKASLEWVLAEVGHDVRTPLASLQLALDELAEQLPDRALATLRRALSDVVYLRSLTSNLGLAARLRGGDWPLPAAGASVDLSEIAQRAVDRAAPFALRRGIDLVSAIAPGVRALGDETGCEQALTNLLENAIAHSGPGTNVSLAVRAGAGQVRVVIEDDGPGLSPEELPRLAATFDGDARPRDRRGAGLGLAITREVCERSGWRVHFEAVAPSGLRAVIEAPRAPGPP